MGGKSSRGDGACGWDSRQLRPAGKPDAGGGGTRGPNYCNSRADYTDVGAGAGASWKLGSKGTLDLEVGYKAYRDFDYHKVGDNYQTKYGAIYGQAGFKLNF